MPLGFWLGWSRVVKGVKGLNIFPRAKDPDLLFFSTSRFVTHQAFPPSQHRAFCFARLEHGPNVFVLSPFVPTFLPPSHPPFLLRSFLLLVLFLYTGSPSLPRFNFSRHFFPFRQREKSGEGREGERRKKAHARCCQSRRVFFRLSQTSQTLVSASV